MMTDPLADLLTRIRNANMRRRESVDIPLSKLKVEVTRVLKEEGFVKDFSLLPERHGILRVYLKYGGRGRTVITGLTRVSTPGRRVYVGKEEIPSVRGGLGVAILSTPQGVMTDRDSRAAGVGGEVLCYVW